MSESIMTPAEAISGIAQGAINIDAGIIEIERGSYVHRAMHELCRLIKEDPKGLAVWILTEYTV